MFVLFFQFLIITTFVVFVYSLIKYALKPERKLSKAKQNKQFYFLDDEDNVRKNFFITYKGLLFEGEKYLEATSDSFDIVRIYVQVDQKELRGLRHEDFDFIEKEVLLRYPAAQLEWSPPVKEFLKKKRPQQ